MKTLSFLRIWAVIILKNYWELMRVAILVQDGDKNLYEKRNFVKYHFYVSLYTVACKDVMHIFFFFGIDFLDDVDNLMI